MRSRLLLAALTSVALSGCATFTNTDAVATVDGVDIDEDRYAELATEYADRSDVFGTESIDRGRSNADQARFLLNALVRQQALRGFLDDADVDATELRRSFLDSVLPGTPLADVSTDFQELAADVDNQFVGQATNGVATPNIDELRAIYADQPVRTGLACVRHILVETESEADAVLADLAGGADFAELALERSIDDSTAATGGAIVGGPQSGECVDLQAMQQGFVRPFVAATIAASEGAPTGPIESTFGWHVIVHRPWDEVATTMAALHQPGRSGALLFVGHLATIDVDVDPRLGRWDPITLTVEPIG